MNGLDNIEKQTYRRHRVSAVFESIFTTVCWSAAEIATKSFGGSVLIVTLLTMAPGVSQSLSLFMTQAMSRLGRRRLLLVSAIFGRAPMLLMFFVSGPWGFLALITVQALAMAPVTTAWNSLLHSNYRESKRGTLYASAARLGTLAAGVAAVLAGIWLEHDQTAYRFIYPIATVGGVLACFLFAKIDVRRSFVEEEGEQPQDSIREIFKSFIADRRFFCYEVGFFVYGLAFMAVMTAKPLRFAGVDDLNFSYETVLGVKGVVSLVMVVSTVAMGRLMDRVGPGGLAARCYGMLAIYCVGLCFVTEPWMYFLVEALFGVAMAGVMIAWNMGPVTLAPSPAHAANYMMVHVALVGLRAAIAHPLGGLIYEFTGDGRYVFAFGAILFVIATVIMAKLPRSASQDS